MAGVVSSIPNGGNFIFQLKMFKFPLCQCHKNARNIRLVYLGKTRVQASCVMLCVNTESFMW